MKERRGLAIWIDAVRFHLRYSPKLSAILPLLLVPVVGDLLQSILIRQHVETNRVYPVKAVQEGCKGFLTLFWVKLQLEIVAFLWGFIPIYGYIKAIEYRLRWGMASNVMAFENKKGAAIKDRCCELVDIYSPGIGVKTLVLTPMFLMIAVLLIWIISGTVFEPIYSYGFWFFFITYFWLVIPWAGAANTFLYLQLRNREAIKTSAS